MLRFRLDLQDYWATLEHDGSQHSICLVGVDARFFLAIAVGTGRQSRSLLSTRSQIHPHPSRDGLHAPPSHQAGHCRYVFIWPFALKLAHFNIFLLPKGVALSDSPIGLAAYILEKFSTWTRKSGRFDADGGLLDKFTMDELLDNVMIYWVTNSITSSMRLYSEALSSKTFGYQLDR